MKKIYTLALMGTLLAGSSLALPAMAQDQAASSSTGSTGALQPRSPEDVTNTLATKLNLSNDQKTQITPIIADRQQKLQALRSDGGRPRQKLRKAKSIMEDSDKKIEAVLNDQQKQQYVALRQQQREEIRERMQGGGGMSPQ